MDAQLQTCWFSSKGRVGWSMFHTAVNELLSFMPAWLTSSWINGIWDIWLLQQEAVGLRVYVSKVFIMRGRVLDNAFCFGGEGAALLEKNNSRTTRDSLYRDWRRTEYESFFYSDYGNVWNKKLVWFEPHVQAKTEDTHLSRKQALVQCCAQELWRKLESLCQSDRISDSKKRIIHLAKSVCHSTEPFWWSPLCCSSLLQNQILFLGSICLF